MNLINWLYYIGGSILDPLTVVFVGLVLLISRRWWIIPIAIAARMVFLAFLFEIVMNQPWAFKPGLQFIISCVQVPVLYVLLNSLKGWARKRKQRE
jgi:hypothetical protein